MAVASAPTKDPLCAIGVAIAIASAQWCPFVPGIFAGYLNTMVGKFQEMSAISSDPPPQENATEPFKVSMVDFKPSIGLPCWSFFGASTKA